MSSYNSTGRAGAMPWSSYPPNSEQPQQVSQPGHVPYSGVLVLPTALSGQGHAVTHTQPNAAYQQGRSQATHSMNALRSRADREKILNDNFNELAARGDPNQAQGFLDGVKEERLNELQTLNTPPPFWCRVELTLDPLPDAPLNAIYRGIPQDPRQRQSHIDELLAEFDYRFGPYLVNWTAEDAQTVLTHYANALLKCGAGHRAQEIAKSLIVRLSARDQHTFWQMRQRSNFKPYTGEITHRVDKMIHESRCDAFSAALLRGAARHLQWFLTDFEFKRSDAMFPDTRIEAAFNSLTALATLIGDATQQHTVTREIQRMVATAVPDFFSVGPSVVDGATPVESRNPNKRPAEDLSSGNPSTKRPFTPGNHGVIAEFHALASNDVDYWSPAQTQEAVNSYLERLQSSSEAQVGVNNLLAGMQPQLREAITKKLLQVTSKANQPASEFHFLDDHIPALHHQVPLNAPRGASQSRPVGEIQHPREIQPHQQQVPPSWLTLHLLRPADYPRYKEFQTALRLIQDERADIDRARQIDRALQSLAKLGPSDLDHLLNDLGKTNHPAALEVAATAFAGMILNPDLPKEWRKSILKVVEDFLPPRFPAPIQAAYTNTLGTVPTYIGLPELSTVVARMLKPSTIHVTERQPAQSTPHTWPNLREVSKQFSDFPDLANLITLVLKGDANSLIAISEGTPQALKKMMSRIEGKDFHAASEMAAAMLCSAILNPSLDKTKQVRIYRALRQYLPGKLPSSLDPHRGAIQERLLKAHSELVGAYNGMIADSESSSGDSDAQKSDEEE